MEDYSLKNMKRYKTQLITVCSTFIIGFITFSDLPTQAKLASIGGVLTVSLILVSQPYTEHQYYDGVNFTIECIKQTIESQYPEKIFSPNKAFARITRLNSIPASKIANELLRLKNLSQGRDIKVWQSQIMIDILKELDINQAQWTYIEDYVDKEMVRINNEPFFNPESHPQWLT